MTHAPMHDDFKKIVETRGALSTGDLEALASQETANSPPPHSRLHEIASFFPAYRRREPSDAEVEIEVCRDISCMLAGANERFERLRAKLPPGSSIKCRQVSCLAMCDQAPAALAVGHGSHCSTLANSPAIDVVRKEFPKLAGLGSPVVESATRPDWRINPYDGSAEYAVVRRLLRENLIDSAAIVKNMENSELLGKGGPATPVWKKWQDVLNADGPRKYVVANGDESEPGTFKDRALLTHYPHLVVEGVLLACLTVGAKEAVIFLRHEFGHEIKEGLVQAIAHANQVIEWTPEHPPIKVEVFVSPGGYICGEQTALIATLEGKRSEPRERPPALEVNGLFGCPTLFNNVETLAWVPAIVWYGGHWYDAQQQPRLFSISGDVVHPGVYELPITTTVGQAIQAAGGMVKGRELLAIAPSGISGGFIPAVMPESKESILNWALDSNEFYRRRKLSLGAGIVVIGDGPDRDLVALAARASEFFRDESCGKCVPCRLGTQKVARFARQWADGELSDSEEFADQEQRIRDLFTVMKNASICGLGQVAANPILTMLNHFPGAKPCMKA